MKGLINIGSIQWLISKGVKIENDSKKAIEIEEQKSNTMIGVSIENKLLVLFY